MQPHSLSLSHTAFPMAPVRADDLRYIISCVRVGHCCSVVGPSNTGKSILLRSLTLPAVREQCTRDTANLPLIIFIDLLGTAESESAFYDAVLSGLIETLERDEEDQTTLIESLQQNHNRMLNDSNMLVIQSLFTRSIDDVMLHIPGGLVIIFDEIDPLLKNNLPSILLRKLRVIRDKYNGKLRYITGTSRYMERIRPDEDVYEFCEMFDAHIRVLVPLCQEDAERFIEYMAEKYDATLDPAARSLLIELSGGHPGMLERLCYSYYRVRPDCTVAMKDNARRFFLHKPVQRECQRLWDELESEECDALLLLSRKATCLTADQQHMLMIKGLLKQPMSEKQEIFSPLFALFIKNTEKGIRCNPDTGQIWVDGRDMTTELSSREHRKLLCLLYQHIGAVCSFEQISLEVWNTDDTPRSTIQEMVRRLRKRVEPQWSNPRYIISVPGVGYRLDSPK
jgi:hypothetical protein